jgi:hypothetical protein
MVLNKELLLKVADHILAHPEEFDMSIYTAPNGCGTVACIAGHGLIMSGYSSASNGNLTAGKSDDLFRPNGDQVWDYHKEAANLFGITEEQAQVLFFHENWSFPYRGNFNVAKAMNDYELQAEIACDYINEFIRRLEAGTIPEELPDESYCD